MENSYIKLYRNLLNWEWYKKPEMVHLFTYLLLKANFSDGKFEGIDIKRGQLITGLNSISQNTGLSVQSIRTCIERLKSTGEITSKSTNKFSLITIVKYEEYQGLDKNSTSKSTSTLTNNQQTINKQSTNNQQQYNKNNKNNKNNKKKNKNNNSLFVDAEILQEEIFPQSENDHIPVEANFFERNTEDTPLTPLEPWPTFSDFWELYDKKVDKEKSETKFNKLPQKVKEAIMAYLPEYITATPDKKYRKNPTTFLNNKSWENEIITKNQSKYIPNFSA